MLKLRGSWIKLEASGNRINFMAPLVSFEQKSCDLSRATLKGGMFRNSVVWAPYQGSCG